MRPIRSIGRIALVACLAAGSAMAQIPTFKTFTGTGTSAANVIIPQQPTSQARVVSIIAQSDLATSALNLYSGTTARYIAQANTNISSVVLVVDATNGLANSSLIYVQGASSNVVLTISSYGSTNVWMGGTVTNALGYIIPTAAVGIPQVVLAEVEVLGNQVTFGQGATTNKIYASDALYVGNYGRAVYATVNGTSNCGYQALTVHYDSASQ